MRHLAYLGALAACLGCALPLGPLLGIRVLGAEPRWRLVMTLLPVLVLFLTWDVYAIAAGHWTFDRSQILGVVLPGGVPLEELLFFLVVPVCAVLGYEAVLRVEAGRRSDAVDDGVAGDDGAAGGRP